MTSHWTQDVIGYEVYVRSFSDSDGDGFGDLEGVRQRLDHLVELGVDVLWLTPIFPSPDADHGYDVTDYDAVDPRYGGLDALDRLLEDAHGRGLRVVMDLVPNHTSSQHPWFQQALQGTGAPRRDWYVWRDPAPDGGPPNNWVSHFGGPAWTLDERSGQYWLHLFLPEQPDLDWGNPAVRAEFERLLEAWFTRGIDGVRIDVAHGMTKDPALRANPLVGDPPTPDLHPRVAFRRWAHLHDLDQDEQPATFHPWRVIADRHGAGLLGEVYLLDADRWARYVDGDRGLHSAFWFPALRTGWDATAIRDALEAALSRAGHRTSWPVSSHDDPYATTRFGHSERALAFLTLVSCLPGSVYLQQGEELGLENADLPADAFSDPISTRNGGAAGRDGTRSPFVWQPGAGWGFTTGTPWLPFGRNRRDPDTAAVQWQTPGSHLRRVRDLFHLRPSLPRTGEARFLDDLQDGLVAARVGATTCVLNAGNARGTVPLSGAAVMRFRSDGGRVDAPDIVHVADVPPDSAVVLVDA